MELYPQSSHDAFFGANMVFPQAIDQAVQQIVAATKGFGTDEKALITVLGSKSAETRHLIAIRYQQHHNKSLNSLMKSEAGGDFGKLLRMIATPLHETEAQLLRDATKGMGTDEKQVVQILSGRTNEEMNILRKTYFNMFNKDLAVTMNSELGGDFKKVIMAMLQSPQEEFRPAVHTAAKAEADAIALYKAGQGRLGTNEEVFIRILVSSPPEFLKMMDAVYVSKYNNNIAKAVDKEFGGDAKKSLNYLVKVVMDPWTTIAEAFEKTMKGFGTDETGLSTCMVRYHSVLPKVKLTYKKLYGTELRDRISGETSGDYRRLLMEMYDAPQDPPLHKSVPGAAGATATSTAAAGAAGASSSSAQHGSTTTTTTTHVYAQAVPGQPGYPPQGAPGYPPQGASGYPPHGAPGYPPQGTPGYPPQGAPGYPPQGAPSYPPQGAPGYPPQGAPGYPPQGAPGYPAYGAPGYPPQGAPGYPPQGTPGYPPQGAPGYPPQGAPGYPPQAAPGYPPQGAPGYPPQGAPGYPSQGAPGYPPQPYQPAPGYPGYPPQH